MPHLVPHTRPTAPVLGYGRPVSAGIPAPLQWILGIGLGGVVTLAAGVFLAFFATGGPVNSTIGALIAPLVLERLAGPLRWDPRLRPMKLAIRLGAAAGFLLNCLFLTRIEWA